MTDNLNGLPPSSPRFYRDTWLSIFRRKGAPGLYTNDWRLLETWQRAVVLKHDPDFDGKDGGTEQAVLGSIESQRTWFALSTQRLIWSNSANGSTINQTGSIPITHLRSVRMDLQRIAKFGIDKTQCRYLHIEAADEPNAELATSNHILMVEPAEPLSGIWNVLLHIVRKNADNRKSI